MREQSRQLIENKGQAGNRMSRPWLILSGTPIPYRNERCRKEAVKLLKAKGRDLSRRPCQHGYIPEGGKCRDIASMIMLRKRKCGKQSRQIIETKGQAETGLAPGGPWPGPRCHRNEKMQEQSRQLIENKEQAGKRVSRSSTGGRLDGRAIPQKPEMQEQSRQLVESVPYFQFRISPFQRYDEFRQRAI